jgi:hypothetical protein
MYAKYRNEEAHVHGYIEYALYSVEDSCTCGWSSPRLHLPTANRRLTDARVMLLLLDLRKYIIIGITSYILGGEEWGADLASLDTPLYFLEDIRLGGNQNTSKFDIFTRGGGIPPSTPSESRLPPLHKYLCRSTKTAPSLQNIVQSS